MAECYHVMQLSLLLGWFRNISYYCFFVGFDSQPYGASTVIWAELIVSGEQVYQFLGTSVKFISNNDSDAEGGADLPFPDWSLAFDAPITANLRRWLERPGRFAACSY